MTARTLILPVALVAAMGCDALSGLSEFRTTGGGGASAAVSASSASSSVATSSTISSAMSSSGSGGAPCDPVPCSDPRVHFCLRFEDNLEVEGQLQTTAIEHGTLAYGNGVRGRALQLDGTSHVEIPSDPLLAPARPFTIELYFRARSLPTSANDLRMVLDIPLTTGIRLWNDARLRVEHYQSSAVSPPIVPDRWYHLVATYEDSELTLYLDGEAFTDGNSPTASAAQSNLYIGANEDQGNTDQQWQGGIDELRLYNEVLTPDELCPIR